MSPLQNAKMKEICTQVSVARSLGGFECKEQPAYYDNYHQHKNNNKLLQERWEGNSQKRTEECYDNWV